MSIYSGEREREIEIERERERERGGILNCEFVGRIVEINHNSVSTLLPTNATVHQDMRYSPQ